MKFRQFVSGFLAMVLITSNANVVFSAESPEIAETTESYLETEYNDDVLSGSAFEVKLMESSDSDTVIYGDIDNDGDIDEDDVTALRQIILGELTADNRTKAASDLNGDGSIDINDVTLLNKYLAGTYEIDPVASGSCGDSVIWELSSSGTLTISGDGNMTDYSSTSSTDIPWYSLRTNIVSVVFEYGVTSIGNYAFYKCSGISNATISNSITNIGKYAFYYCSSLINISIPNSITSIGAGAFSNCTNLTSAVISENVRSISDYVFTDCKSLKSIVIPENVTSISMYAFYECTNLTTVSFPSGLNSIGASAFRSCTNLTDIDMPENVTSIGKMAFHFCISLTEITMPANVKKIGDGAFAECNNLTSINVDGDNTYYCSVDGVLYDKNLTSLIGYPAGKVDTNYDIPNSVININSYAFYSCHNLEIIELPNSVNNIEDSSFAYCSNLISIFIPSSVTSIYTTAFRGCDTDNLIFYVEADSYALSYAEENGYNYEIISDEEIKIFEMPEDGYSFANSAASFGYEDGYKISDEVYKMFMSELDFLVFSIPEWSGSCFGIAATCLGFFEYDESRTLYSDIFGLGTDTPFYDFDSLYDISAPNGISELDVLTKWIEIFYASQYNDSSQSIIFSDNYSYSKNNWANMDNLVAAIENFAETGSDPIVLCLVSDRNTGHAVVPYDIEDNTETEGCYTVYIYDNNYPGIVNELYIYKDESGFSGYDYDQYDYKISYIYEQDIYDIVYSAYASSVSLAEADPSESAKIYVNSDNVSIVDSNGTSVENIDGAYEIFYMDSASDTRVFSVPYGDYTVKNNDSSLSELNVSVITSLDGKSISVGDNTAAITLGVYDNGYTYIGANSSSNCNMEITTVNSSGQKKVIEADCTYLFVETTEPDTVYVKSSESTVYVNGVSTKVSSLTGTALSTQDVSSGIIDIGTIILGDYDYYFEESGNTDLSCSDGKIMGNICLNLYNKSGSSFSAVVVAAVYDSEGKLVYSENKSVTVGNNSNYISLKNLDIEVSENDSYSCRVFLWKDMLSMRPITAPVDIEIS